MHVRPWQFVVPALAVALSFGGCGGDGKSGDTKGGTAKGGEGDKGAAAKGDEGATKSDDGAKGAGAGAGDTAGAAADEPPVDAAKLAEEVGVEPGPWERPKDEGGAAYVSEKEGTVEVRRTGEETFSALGLDDLQLFAGDQLRTGADSSALVTLVDETVVEVAADSTVAIGDRDAGADPASSVAVLYGVARFSVSPRGEGEGPFLVYVPSGIVGAKGTTYGVGVAATGQVRVGVESGTVEVVGSAKLDAPTSIAAGQVVLVTPDGEVGATADFKTDDWGEWRATAEADVEPKKLAEYHASKIEDLEKDTRDAYDDLADLSDEATAGATKAGEFEAAADPAGYEAAEPEVATAVESAYLESLRLQYLTYAMMHHAYVVDELYVRYPDEVRPVYVTVAPAVRAVPLYHKKYHYVVHEAVLPLRPIYYVHHPVGRVHAVAVGVPVPVFYASVKLKPLPPGHAKRLLGPAYYYPPAIVAPVRVKHVVYGPPIPGWNAHVKVRPAPMRAKVWYARPAHPGRLVGVKVVARPHTVFHATKAVPRASGTLVFGAHRAGPGPGKGVVFGAGKAGPGPGPGPGKGVVFGAGKAGPGPGPGPGKGAVFGAGKAGPGPGAGPGKGAVFGAGKAGPGPGGGGKGAVFGASKAGPKGKKGH